MTKWHTVRLGIDSVKYSTDKAVLIKVPASTLLFWHPIKCFKKHDPFITISFSDNWVFKVFDGSLPRDQQVSRDVPARELHPRLDPDFQSVDPIAIAAQENAHTVAFEPTVKAGQTIKISKGFAAGLTEKGITPKLVFNLEVTEAVKETERAILVKFKASSKAVGHCVCCGRILTDAYSIAANVGETCAKNWGIKRDTTDATKKELSKILDTITGESWIPKSCIKEIA